MKKFLITLLLVAILSSVCYGAASEDTNIYVRQDVFDAKIEALFTRLHGEIESLGNRLEGKIEALSVRIDGLEKRIDGLDKRIDGFDKRIDGFDKRIDDTHKFLYYILVLFGAMLFLPFISRLFEMRKEFRTPPVTLDDVRRLIEENNAKLLQKLQVS